MLRNLSIRDVVLIGSLDISFNRGLGVLTGETGAGKSILLDSLGLSLGMRADAKLVRHGATRALVTAVFDLAAGHPIHNILADQGIDCEDGDETLILRRLVNVDGRSRAFINDQAVSISLLRRIGESLVEIHGQLENHHLLDPASHGPLLDAYSGTGRLIDIVSANFDKWQRASMARLEAEEKLALARRDEEFLRHAVAELTALDPKPGEESELASKRALMMHGEKMLEAMNKASEELSSGRGAVDALGAALRHLEGVADKCEGRLDEAIAALASAAREAAEGSDQLERAVASLDLDPQSLENAEERLFAIRGLARKHNVDVDSLPALSRDMADQLASVEDGGNRLVHLESEEKTARAAYIEAAEKLRAARRAGAVCLDKAVSEELAPLKMGKAKFSTLVEPVEEANWGKGGYDRIRFQVATNPGMPPGPLQRISSGGELARFMLALKVVLADADQVPSIVFDEVDSGVGGAVAAAIGERMVGLSKNIQVLVLTHSPQVAARGAYHWRVSKSETGDGVVTSVELLSDDGRVEEIARMLAGENITDEARAAAASLLRG